MAYKNIMEEVVVEELNGVLHKMGKKHCGCELCREDIVAWVLNRLPPKYVVTKTGYVYSKYETLKNQLRADIVSALVKGAKVVKKKPRH